MYEIIYKRDLPILMITLIAVCGQYIYMVDGQVNLFRLFMVFGVPFGIPYMLIVLPIGGSISRGVGILALNAIIGAMFGCVIAVIVFAKAAIFTLRYVAGGLMKRRKE